MPTLCNEARCLIGAFAVLANCQQHRHQAPREFIPTGAKGQSKHLLRPDPGLQTTLYPHHFPITQ
jgi:hypothetical protein